MRKRHPRKSKKCPLDKFTFCLDAGIFASKDPNKTANLMIDYDTVKNNQSEFLNVSYQMII